MTPVIFAGQVVLTAIAFAIHPWLGIAFALGYAYDLWFIAIKPRII